MKTKQLSTIHWGSQHAFGCWIDRLRGQKDDRFIPLAFSCLIRLDLESCDLDGKNLCRANLDGANLYLTDLSGANLYGANLCGANLCGANLSEANLEEANLYGASLDGATLDGATLDWATLDWATLYEATLYDIYWNDRTSWKNVRDLENAIDVPEALKQLLSQNTPEEDRI